MENENKHIEDYLLGKWFTGGLTEEERTEIEDWAAQAPENQKLLTNSKQVLNDVQLLNAMKKVDRIKAFGQVNRKIERSAKPTYHLFRNWQKIAAILLLPIMLMAVYEAFELIKITSQKTVWNEISTPIGLRSQFQLPDGSKVWLNSNSHLKYPLVFTGDERLVQLEGEAYFEVAPDKKHPFIVDAGNINIQAIGTSFNISAYQSDFKLETALTEGKVNVYQESDHGRRFITSLEPGQLSVYNYKTKDHRVLNGNLDKNTAWRNGKIIFRNDNLDEVLRKLGQWYNVDFEVSYKIQKQYSYTGTFQGESLHQILEYIELTTPIKFDFSHPKKDKTNTFEKRRIKVELKRTENLSKNK
ncbi:MAG: FecR domain-containing protein [Salinivirgaceae bacterium]|nr:FecR domain-containing protein [Salinivirgaceae bacterium]